MSLSKVLKYFSLLFLTLLLVACNDKESLVYLESLPVEHVEFSKMPLTPRPELLTKIFEIGVWDMTQVGIPGSIAIPHGLGLNNHYNIRRISVMIRPDFSPISAKFYDFVGALDFTAVSDQIILITPDNIVLTSASGSFFDISDFGDLDWNRGWVTIDYVPEIFVE